MGGTEDMRVREPREATVASGAAATSGAVAAVGHSVLWSFHYAIDGLVWALRTQRNMRLHLGAAISVVVVSLLLGVSRMQLVALVFAVALVFITELVNSAVEATVDLATQCHDPLARTAKDVAASAVLVAAICSVIVAYLVLFEPLRQVLQRGFEIVRFASADLTVIAIGLVLLAVLVGKGVSHQPGTWLEGGWPSGHVALAFAAATILGFATWSATALMLGGFIALLVAQSRLQAGIHTVPQVLAGALLGTLLVTVVFQVFFR